MISAPTNFVPLPGPSRYPLPKRLHKRLKTSQSEYKTPKTLLNSSMAKRKNSAKNAVSKRAKTISKAKHRHLLILHRFCSPKKKTRSMFCYRRKLASEIFHKKSPYFQPLSTINRQMIILPDMRFTKIRKLLFGSKSSRRKEVGKNRIKQKIGLF